MPVYEDAWDKQVNTGEYCYNGNSEALSFEDSKTRLRNSPTLHIGCRTRIAEEIWLQFYFKTWLFFSPSGAPWNFFLINISNHKLLLPPGGRHKSWAAEGETVGCPPEGHATKAAQNFWARIPASGCGDTRVHEHASRLICKVLFIRTKCRSAEINIKYDDI